MRVNVPAEQSGDPQVLPAPPAADARGLDPDPADGQRPDHAAADDAHQDEDDDQFEPL
jgi:hypothetical protein